MTFPYGYPNLFQLQLYHNPPKFLKLKRVVMGLSHSVLSETQFIMGTTDKNLSVLSLFWN